MDTNRPRNKITIRNILKALQIDQWFVLLDLALLMTIILMVFTEAMILFFHAIFLLLTFGAFYWQFRAFVLRTGFWVSVASVIMLSAVLTGELPGEELIEIPALIAILALVFVIAGHRARAEEALHHALRETKQRQAEVSALWESSRTVLAYRDFEDTARSIFDSCKHLIGATSGCVALLTEDGTEDELLFLDTGGDTFTIDPTLSMPVRGLREKAIRTGKPVFENDFPSSEEARFLPEGEADLNNVLFAPLMIGGRAVGLLGLANKPGDFTENDAYMTSVFSELAAIALFNNRNLESLQNSEERFRSVAQTASEAMITVDNGGNIIFWNKAAATMFGYLEDQAVGRPLTFIMPDRFRLAYRKGIARVVSTGTSDMFGKVVEMFGLRRDGAEFPIELSLSSWKIKKEIFFTGVIRDITERKQAEAAEMLHKEELRQANEALEKRVLERTVELTEVNAELVREITQHKQTAETLRESEERYRHLVELGFQAIVIHSQGKFVYVNGPAVELVGAVSPEEVIGKPLREFVHPDEWDLVQAQLKQIQEEGKGVPLAELRLIRRDGANVEVEAMSVPIIYQGQAAVQSVIRDISVRKQAESERARERARIARDLHDSLGHSLAYLHLKLSELSGEDALADVEKAQQNLGQMCDVANQAYEVVRGMLAASLPSNSTDLVTALLIQARTVGKRANFEVQLTSQGQSRPLPPVMQQQLLYIFQEALANVEKHADARQVEINLKWSETTLTITLADDGCGFPPDVPQLKGHFGLAIMQERAQGINGHLTLSPSPDGGTQLILHLPLASVESVT